MFLNITIWQYIMQIQHIYVETVFCSSLRLHEFWKIDQKLCAEVSKFLIDDYRDSQTVNIPIVKSFRRHKD